jgi:hypothetical protein
MIILLQYLLPRFSLLPATLLFIQCYIVYVFNWVDLRFNSKFIDITILRSILITLHRNVSYFSNIYILIDRKDVLKLILDLEFEQITFYENKSSKIASRPFLLMVKDCSEDL